MVPEIWSTTDITFCHSVSFFALLPLYELRKSKFSKKWKTHLKILSSYKQIIVIWCMVQLTEFFVIFDCFLLFTPHYPPPTSPTPKTKKMMKKLKKKKKKKTPGDIILHKCTKIHDHMLYFSLDIAHNRCNYFSFQTIF